MNDRNYFKKEMEMMDSDWKKFWDEQKEIFIRSMSPEPALPQHSVPSLTQERYKQFEDWLFSIVLLSQPKLDWEHNQFVAWAARRELATHILKELKTNASL